MSFGYSGPLAACRYLGPDLPRSNKQPASICGGCQILSSYVKMLPSLHVLKQMHLCGLGSSSAMLLEININVNAHDIYPSTSYFVNDMQIMWHDL